MKIAILYICTGKYSIFWNQFYESCEKNFLPHQMKSYFVFSDTIGPPLPRNVELIYQQKIGWPDDTLLRFHLFSGIRQRLESFDYIFFCNANTHFTREVSDYILKVNKQAADLIVVKHPFFHWVKNPIDFPYERRTKSRAYIPKNEGEVYVMGGFNGGNTKTYLKLIEELKNRIEEDRTRNIVARWHDESHLNKYLLDFKHALKVLDYNYGYPEGHDLPLKTDIYITFLDKVNFGGHDFLRGQSNSVPQAPVSRMSFFTRLKNRLLPSRL